jgi:hypothetical protein
MPPLANSYSKQTANPAEMGTQKPHAQKLTDTVPLSIAGELDFWLPQ